MVQKQQQEKREQEAEQRKRKLKLEQKNDLEKSALAKLSAMQKAMSTSEIPSQPIKVKEETVVKPIEKELTSTSVRNESKQEKPSVVTVKQSHKTLSLDTNNNHQETDGMMEVVPSPTIAKTPRRLKEEKTIQLFCFLNSI